MKSFLIKLNIARIYRSFTADEEHNFCSQFISASLAMWGQLIHCVRGHIDNFYLVLYSKQIMCGILFAMVALMSASITIKMISGYFIISGQSVSLKYINKNFDDPKNIGIFFYKILLSILNCKLYHHLQICQVLQKIRYLCNLWYVLAVSSTDYAIIAWRNNGNHLRSPLSFNLN